MIKYYIKPNGTGTAYMVTCDTENEAQGELWSLQNKGVATEAEIVSPTSFIFFASKARLLKAFAQQFICKHWLDAESCKLYKGEKGGFYADAQKYASENNIKLSNAYRICQYNPPFFPLFYRRNEIIFEIVSAS